MPRNGALHTPDAARALFEGPRRDVSRRHVGIIRAIVIAFAAAWHCEADVILYEPAGQLSPVPYMYTAPSTRTGPRPTRRKAAPNTLAATIPPEKSAMRE